MSLPAEVLAAMVVRNEAREALAKTEAALQKKLKPYAGQTFELEGVPFKVCGSAGNLYLRRMVNKLEAAALRESWRKS